MHRTYSIPTSWELRPSPSRPRTCKDFCRWNDETYPDIGPLDGPIPEKVDCIIVGAGIAGRRWRSLKCSWEWDISWYIYIDILQYITYAYHIIRISCLQWLEYIDGIYDMRDMVVGMLVWYNSQLIWPEVCPTLPLENVPPAFRTEAFTKPKSWPRRANPLLSLIDTTRLAASGNFMATTAPEWTLRSCSAAADSRRRVMENPSLISAVLISFISLIARIKDGNGHIWVPIYFFPDFSSFPISNTSVCMFNFRLNEMSHENERSRHAEDWLSNSRKDRQLGATQWGSHSSAGHHARHLRYS